MMLVAVKVEEKDVQAVANESSDICSADSVGEGFSASTTDGNCKVLSIVLVAAIVAWWLVAIGRRKWLIGGQKSPDRAARCNVERQERFSGAGHCAEETEGL